MIICSCHNINHQKIEELLKSHPQCNREFLSQKTKAGTDCGICVATLEEMLETLGNSKEKPNNREKNHPQHKSNYWEQL